MFCAKCNAELPEGAKFCFKCGAKMEDKIICSSCKTELPLGAQFCFNCGNKITNEVAMVENEIDLSIPKEFEAMLYGVNITVPVDEIYFFEVVNLIGSKVGDYMLEAYNRLNGLDQVVSRLPEIVKEIYYTATKMILQILADGYKRYDITEEDILADSWDIMTGMLSVYKRICESHRKFTGEKREAELYREMRRDSRFKLRGGGFGLSGAAKGIIVAEGVNLVTGLFHSAFNAIDEMYTDSDIDNRMKKVYKKYAEYIKPAVMIDITQMMLSVNERYIWPGHKYMINGSNKKRSKGIVASIKAGRVPKADIKNQVVDAICLDIGNPAIFIWAYNILGDPNGELKALAEKLEYKAVIEHIEKSAQEAAEYGKKSIQIEKFFGKMSPETKNKIINDHYYSSILDNMLRPLPEMFVLMYYQMIKSSKYKKAFEEKVFVYCDDDFSQKWDKAVRAIPYFGMIRNEEAPIFVYCSDIPGRGKYGIMITDRALYTPYSRIELSSFLNCDIVSDKDSELYQHYGYSFAIQGNEVCSFAPEDNAIAKDICDLIGHYMYLSFHSSEEQRKSPVSKDWISYFNNVAQKIKEEYRAFNMTWFAGNTVESLLEVLSYYLKNNFFDSYMYKDQHFFSVFFYDGTGKNEKYIKYAIDHFTTSKKLEICEYPILAYYNRDDMESIFESVEKGILITTKNIYVFEVDYYSNTVFKTLSWKEVNYIYPSPDAQNTILFNCGNADRNLTYHTSLPRKYSDLFSQLNLIFNKNYCD